MKNLSKVDNKLDDNKIMVFDKPKQVEFSSLFIENEKPFTILVKNNEIVKINQPILENEDGQKILSSISGKVVNIGLKNNYRNELTYTITIENDFKNEIYELSKKEVKNKNDLIDLIKNYGVVNNNSLIYKIIEKTNKILYINAFDDIFIYNNFVVLENYINEIKYSLNLIKDLFNIEKTIFYSNKNNIKNLKLLSKSNDKIIIKQPKKNVFLNLIDLLNIFYAIKGKPQTEKIISVTGKALNKNKVLLVKNGTEINEIIDFFGGIKQNLEEIENYKYTAMLAYNDELILKDKIKKCKDMNDKQKLIKMLENKQKEAYENVYSKREEFYKKYLNCLSVCLISENNKKIEIFEFNNSILNKVDGLHLLNFQQF